MMDPTAIFADEMNRLGYDSDVQGERVYVTFRGDRSRYARVMVKSGAFTDEPEVRAFARATADRLAS